jgi:hypothetical protein
MVNWLTSFLIYCGLIALHYIYIPPSYPLVRLANQICCLFVVMLFCRLIFDHVTACCLYYHWGTKKLAIGGRRVLQQQRKIKELLLDEELLITGVSVSEENQWVLNDGVSASWMNDERLLGNGVSATWMNDEGLLANGVSATKRRNNCWKELFR